MDDDLELWGLEMSEVGQRLLEGGLVAAVLKVPLAPTERRTLPPPDARLEIGHLQRARRPVVVGDGLVAPVAEDQSAGR